MELNDYIKKVLEQIAEGVRAAQETVSQNGGAVNPRLIEVREMLGRTADGNMAQLVEFDIAVTVTKTSEGGGGATLSVLSFGFELGGKKDASNEATHRVKFAVPLALPEDQESVQRMDQFMPRRPNTV